MDPQIVVGLLAFTGLLGTTLFTQTLLHRRWTREQDAKRAEILAEQAEQRRLEAEQQARERREEIDKVVSNAVRLAEVHQADAEKARLLALETAQSHAECRQEVATLTGKVDELRSRIVENERSTGRETLISQRHQDLKHKTLTALTVSEGITNLAVKLAKDCTCHAFDPINALTERYHPRLNELLEENRMSLDEWLTTREQT